MILNHHALKFVWAQANKLTDQRHDSCRNAERIQEACTQTLKLLRRHVQHSS